MPATSCCGHVSPTIGVIVQRSFFADEMNNMLAYCIALNAYLQFGGKLVTFANIKTATGPQTTYPEVNISQVITEKVLLERSVALENTLNSGHLANFCDAKIAVSADKSESDIWHFLKVCVDLMTYTFLTCDVIIISIIFIPFLDNRLGRLELLVPRMRTVTCGLWVFVVSWSGGLELSASSHKRTNSFV